MAEVVEAELLTRFEPDANFNSGGANFICGHHAGTQGRSALHLCRRENPVVRLRIERIKPVWGTLERYWKPLREKREGAGRRSGTLHLAMAQSNRGRRGRKRDFPDAERLVKRLVARELTLSFVPDAEQRLWRTVTRRKDQLTPDPVRLQNQLEALL